MTNAIFEKKKKALLVNIVYMSDTVNERVAQKWFLRFSAGNYAVKDTHAQNDMLPWNVTTVADKIS